MKTFYFFCSFFILYQCPAFSQQTTSFTGWVNTTDNHPAIHLHTDRNVYFAGELIRYKAYLMKEGLPAQNSTSLFTILQDASGKKLAESNVPISESTTNGYLTLPDSIASQWLTLLSYTDAYSTSSNQYINHIYCAGNTTAQSTAIAQASKAASLVFFAESGNFIANNVNDIAFKATLANGMPMAVSGIINNSKGEPVDSFATLHDGMGLIQLSGEPGEKYSATWKDDLGTMRITTLPEINLKGVSLHTEQAGNELYYLIKSVDNNETSNRYFIKAEQHDTVVYAATMDLKNTNKALGKIPLADLSTGLLQVTIFNSNNEPLAERMAFIKVNDYRVGASIKWIEKNIEKRKKNTIEVNIPDTFYTSLSVAITHALLDVMPSQGSVFSDLLLSGYLRGYVHNPAYYFNDSNTISKKHLDLVMQTNGWRRFSSTEKLSEPVALNQVFNGQYLTIKGLLQDNNQQPLANQELQVLIKCKDSSRQLAFPVTDAKGVFTIPNLVYFDTATMYYKLKSNSKSAYTITLQNDVRQISASPLLAINKFEGNAGIEADKILSEQKKASAGNFETSVKTLNTVTIKAQQERKVKIDQRYTTGLFSGGSNSFAFDLMSDSNSSASFDIYNYLTSKIPGCKLVYRTLGKEFLIGNVSPVLYVNESLVENDQLQNISMENIAYVKYIPFFLGRRDDAGKFPPAISVYLKKGADYKSNDPNEQGNGFKLLMVPGYTAVKEFYQPDYSIKNVQSNPATDIRNTIYWNPSLTKYREDKKLSINFYNDDYCKKFKVVITGMNEAGQLIYLEQMTE